MRQRSLKKDLSEQADAVYPAALAYLARREYAVEELRLRLLQRGAAEEVVEDTITRLISAGYLSDERFAAGRVRTRRDFSRKGRLAVRMELRQLGVSEEAAEEALANEYDEETERAIVRQLAAGPLREIAQIEDKALRQKKNAALARRLLARGFRAAIVREVLADENQLFLE